MSARCTARVWSYSKARGAGRLVILAIADYARDDGTGAWPSVATLAKKTLLAVRAVHYAIRSLQEMGEITIEQGAGPKGCNLYAVTVWGDEQIVMDPLDRGANGAGVQTVHLQSKTGGVQSKTSRGANVAPKPLVDPLENPLSTTTPGSASVLVVPAPLEGFDRILRSCPIDGYTPSEDFYAKVLEKYSELDLTEEALKATDWICGPKARKEKRTLSRAFILNWLRRARNGDGSNGNGTGQLGTDTGIHAGHDSGADGWYEQLPPDDA